MDDGRVVGAVLWQPPAAPGALGTARRAISGAALWTLGRKAEAVQWYAAAVRTEPQQWNGTDRYAELLPGWRDSERSTLAEVQRAWAEKPPAWP